MVGSAAQRSCDHVPAAIKTLGAGGEQGSDLCFRLKAAAEEGAYASRNKERGAGEVIAGM